MTTPPAFLPWESAAWPRLSPRLRTSLWTGLVFMLVAVTFGLAYTQTALYEGNQNTKFLHGLAQARGGVLQEDWLANTVDPLPVFSFLVFVTAKVSENLFYVTYILLMGVYVYSLLGILSTLHKTDWRKYLLLFTALLWLHARWIIRIALRRNDIDLELFHFGVAGQYLLGQEFQNSAFGVFLLLSIYQFLRLRYVLAILCIALASLLHSAYLFSAALLTGSFLLLIFFDQLKLHKDAAGFRRLLAAARRPFWLGLLALVLVAPVVWHNQVILTATTPEASAEALRILVHERIPHHSLPSVWLGRGAYIQIALMLAGLLLAARTPRLFVPMLSLALGGLALTLVQVITASNSLALMAPWRVSVLLVPLSTSLILGLAAHLLVDRLKLGKLPYQWLLIPVTLWILYVTLSHGIELQRMSGTSFRLQRFVPTMEYVKATAVSGDVYLVMPREPEFDDFRLYANAPILANWKSHPYIDAEVIEWYERVNRAVAFYNTSGPEKCTLLEGLARDYGVNHVILKGLTARLECEFTSEEFRNDKYVLYRLENP